jgi:inner membrane protein
MESLSFSPVAQNRRVMLDAGWPHPSFVGGFLPVEYQVDDDSFTAEWNVSGLATGWRKPWIGWDQSPPVPSAMDFGVSLFNSVDVYQQAMRSVKYGNLIVLLTFTAFFLIETVRRLMLHPLQYLLIGLALVIFFLLLLALSEHIVFWAAYVIAAASCAGLVAVYTAAVLRSLPNAVGVGAILGGLYGMLYAIMMSEDNALLMGSLLLFAALAAVMLVTRRIDWYRMGRELRPPGELAVTD